MIECADVEFSYDGERPVLRGVTLDIAEGEFLCVLGGNGSGKSTFAKHLNALLVPDAGCVRVSGLKTADPEFVFDIRSQVGMVFQNPDDQIVATLVENDTAFGPENLGMPPEKIAANVAAALKAVGLVGFERRETHSLSGGQKQRVACAGVLAMEPRMLILDEATSMLDPAGRAALLRICHGLHERGMGIVMITHFMEEAAEADRVVVLEGGRITRNGTPAEVLSCADELRALNLEAPAACNLGLALRERGVDVAVRVRESEMIAEVERVYREGVSAGAIAAPAVSDAAAERDEPQASEPTGAPVIEFSHVSFAYSVTAGEYKRVCRRAARRGADPHEGITWSLRDVSLSVHEGEFLGLAGHTGSGKSTLVQHMNGLLHPLEGEVRAFGKDLSGKEAAFAVKQRVGVVFQYPERQLFAQTVAEDVAFGPRNLGLAEDEVARRVAASLARVGLNVAEVGEMSPFELSGGQQRRVAFAGVLAMEPEVLVLDEPAAGLDPMARREFLDFVDGLHNDGLTVVMVSHSMDDLARYCDRVVMLDGGAVFAAGAPESVFLRGDELASIGLGVPAAQRMAQSLAAAGVPVPTERLHSIDSLADALSVLMGARRQPQPTGEVR